MYELNRQHIDNVLRLSGPQRYGYMVKRSADWGKFYGLQSHNGWALAGDNSDAQFFPVWPHEYFAQLCTSGDWSDCKPVEISITDWFDQVSGMLESKGLGLAVFPIPQGRGVIVSRDRFSADLEQELQKIED